MIKLQLQPDFMHNPKVWAKIVIVVLLTINGFLVHKLILPLLVQSAGRRLFDGTTARQIAGMTFPGSVSLVSWSLPLILGKAAGLKFITPMSSILATYLACILAAWLGLFAFLNCIRGIQVLAAKSKVDVHHLYRPDSNNIKYSVKAFIWWSQPV